MKATIVRIVLCLLFFGVVAISPANAETIEAEISAETAILIDEESGRILFEKNKDQPMRIASITKIMTAVLALEHGDLEEEVKVSEEAVRAEGSSLYLQAGTKIPLEDLVYGLMLRSGNDSAVAIAEHVGGSLEGFSIMMNEKAEQLGMNNSYFNNPHGLDDHEQHYSSAHDMARLMQYAMKDEQFRAISATETYKTDNPAEDWNYEWRNKNKLLTSLYSYTTGGKTGYTKRAKRTLVTTAEKEGDRFIAVTLNAPSDWNDHIRMYEEGFEAFDTITLAEEGKQPLVQAPEGKDVYLHEAIRYPLTEEERKRVRQAATFHSPRERRSEHEERVTQEVGHLTFELDDRTIARSPLFEEKQLDQQEGWRDRIWRMIRSFME
ncbi:D-alanyl-D-alanine carboxypeptidase family protein [Salsuginibacillus kocurii]|uniref:D-alanyl-D-alanine carboxypeptidase family protein n=1 Tax=Salsuginibacillus kocurii TaxID=427078 RepID=UPI00035DB514|nr:D-alanyl-D-alanine carboxypeptidase family protein [Salsuginibacillus kocurii]